MKIKYRKCITCLGKGKLPIKYAIYSPKKRAQARAMFKAGIGLRTIGKALGINHPQKVKSLIKSKK